MFLQDEVVTNDGWGKDTSCKHGDFYTCRVNYMPDKLVNHKWERCQSIDKNSWGYRKDMQASEVMDLSSIINVRSHSRSLPADVCPAICDQTFDYSALM